MRAQSIATSLGALIVTLLVSACRTGDATGVATRADVTGTLAVQQTSSGDLWPVGSCDAGSSVRMWVEGSGTATHVGKFTIQKSMCLNPATGAVTDGLAALRAANGDQIHMVFQGQAQAGVQPTTIDFVYTIVGGTGRFAHAEGALDVRTVLTSASTWTSSGNGWMSYTASDRAGG